MLKLILKCLKIFAIFSLILNDLFPLNSTLIICLVLLVLCSLCSIMYSVLCSLWNDLTTLQRSLQRSFNCPECFQRISRSKILTFETRPKSTFTPHPSPPSPMLKLASHSPKSHRPTQVTKSMPSDRDIPPKRNSFLRTFDWQRSGQKTAAASFRHSTACKAPSTSKQPLPWRQI